jgi:hypothetical protein
VTDFGIALTSTVAESPVSPGFAGTANFMPPEAFDGQCSAKSDVWSLGCTLVRVLSGRDPYFGVEYNRLLCLIAVEGRAPDIPPGLSDACEDFLHRTFRPSDSERATAAELLAHPWLLQTVASLEQAVAGALGREASTALLRGGFGSLLGDPSLLSDACVASIEQVMCSDLSEVGSPSVTADAKRDEVRAYHSRLGKALPGMVARAIKVLGPIAKASPGIISGVRSRGVAPVDGAQPRKRRVNGASIGATLPRDGGPDASRRRAKRGGKRVPKAQPSEDAPPKLAIPPQRTSLESAASPARTLSTAAAYRDREDDEAFADLASISLVALKSGLARASLGGGGESALDTRSLEASRVSDDMDAQFEAADRDVDGETSRRSSTAYSGSTGKRKPRAGGVSRSRSRAQRQPDLETSHRVSSHSSTSRQRSRLMPRQDDESTAISTDSGSARPKKQLDAWKEDEGDSMDEDATAQVPPRKPVVVQPKKQLDAWEEDEGDSMDEDATAQVPPRKPVVVQPKKQLDAWKEDEGDSMDDDKFFGISSQPVVRRSSQAESDAQFSSEEEKDVPRSKAAVPDVDDDFSDLETAPFGGGRAAVKTGPSLAELLDGDVKTVESALRALPVTELSLSNPDMAKTVSVAAGETEEACDGLISLVRSDEEMQTQLLRRHGLGIVADSVTAWTRVYRLAASKCTPGHPLNQTMRDAAGALEATLRLTNELFLGAEDILQVLLPLGQLDAIGPLLELSSPTFPPRVRWQTALLVCLMTEPSEHAAVGHVGLEPVHLLMACRGASSVTSLLLPSVFPGSDQGRVDWLDTTDEDVRDDESFAPDESLPGPHECPVPAVWGPPSEHDLPDVEGWIDREGANDRALARLALISTSRLLVSSNPANRMGSTARTVNENLRAAILRSGLSVPLAHLLMDSCNFVSLLVAHAMFGMPDEPLWSRTPAGMAIESSAQRGAFCTFRRCLFGVRSGWFLNAPSKLTSSSSSGESATHSLLPPQHQTTLPMFLPEASGSADLIKHSVSSHHSRPAHEPHTITTDTLSILSAARAESAHPHKLSTAPLSGMLGSFSHGLSKESAIESFLASLDSRLKEFGTGTPRPVFGGVARVGQVATDSPASDSSRHAAAAAAAAALVRPAMPRSMSSMRGESGVIVPPPEVVDPDSDDDRPVWLAPPLRGIHLDLLSAEQDDEQGGHRRAVTDLKMPIPPIVDTPHRRSASAAKPAAGLPSQLGGSLLPPSASPETASGRGSELSQYVGKSVPGKPMLPRTRLKAPVEQDKRRKKKHSKPPPVAKAVSVGSVEGKPEPLQLALDDAAHVLHSLPPGHVDASTFRKECDSKAKAAAQDAAAVWGVLTPAQQLAAWEACEDAAQCIQLLLSLSKGRASSRSLLASPALCEALATALSPAPRPLLQHPLCAVTAAGSLEIVAFLAREPRAAAALEAAGVVPILVRWIADPGPVGLARDIRSPLVTEHSVPEQYQDVEVVRCTALQAVFYLLRLQPARQARAMRSSPLVSVLCRMLGSINTRGFTAPLLCEVAGQCFRNQDVQEELQVLLSLLWLVRAGDTWSLRAVASLHNWARQSPSVRARLGSPAGAAAVTGALVTHEQQLREALARLVGADPKSLDVTSSTMRAAMVASTSRGREGRSPVQEAVMIAAGGWQMLAPQVSQLLSTSPELVQALASGPSFATLLRKLLELLAPLGRIESIAIRATLTILSSILSVAESASDLAREAAIPPVLKQLAALHDVPLVQGMAEKLLEQLDPPPDDNDDLGIVDLEASDDDPHGGRDSHERRDQHDDHRAEESPATPETEVMIVEPTDTRQSPALSEPTTPPSGLRPGALSVTPTSAPLSPDLALISPEQGSPAPLARPSLASPLDESFEFNDPRVSTSSSLVISPETLESSNPGYVTVRAHARHVSEQIARSSNKQSSQERGVTSTLSALSSRRLAAHNQPVRHSFLPDDDGY